MRNRLLVCALGALFVCSRALSAEISYIDFEPFTHQSTGPASYLLLSGDIVPGDYKKLLSTILENKERFLFYDQIILASNGGDVAEAIRIAKLVKSLYAEVVVGPITGRCVSACFLIYAAANERTSDDERLIGIHRPYLPDSQLASLSPADAQRAEDEVLRQARKYLEENDVPAYLIEEMFRRSSRDVYWLTNDDLERLGYQSPSFNQYLVAKCDWKGSMPFGIEELRPEVAKCRIRFTIPAAKDALRKAVGEYVSKYGPLPGIEPPQDDPPPEAGYAHQYSAHDIRVGRCYDLTGSSHLFSVADIANGVVTYVDHDYMAKMMHQPYERRSSMGIEQFARRVDGDLTDAVECADSQ